MSLAPEGMCILPGFPFTLEAVVAFTFSSSLTLPDERSTVACGDLQD